MKRYRLLLIAAALPALLAAGLLRPWAAPEDPAAAALAAADAARPAGGLKLDWPLDGTLFPRDLAAPLFSWKEVNPACSAWAVSVRFADGSRLVFPAGTESWRPGQAAWERIKKLSLGKEAELSVVCGASSDPGRPLASGSVRFATSPDAVGAPVFYREVNLPFSEAVKDPTRIRWRIGRVSDAARPSVVLENLPVCGNCHSFSRDGSVLGMDVDYANDKGSYAIVPTGPEAALDKTRLITWSDYKRGEGDLTFGLLSQVSPDGRYVLSTVKDRSVFVARPDLAFSQLFFPVQGILAFYSRAEKAFRALPGADDPALVQSNPSWSPDGRWVVFARAKAQQLRNLRDKSKTLLAREECAEFIEGGQKFLFDLYRVPFNGGKGGRAEPLRGASGDGKSNFFARYSPDGKWIVFCKAASFMLLQPDSELWIVPAAGGEARRMRCNLKTMNSWHSWSPNGRWLVFASKANTPYTQLFLTHVGEDGADTPPVLLDWFTAPDRAANIPEFAPGRAGTLKRLVERFLDSLSYRRAGLEYARADDAEGAVASYRKSLELEPGDPEVNMLLGVALEKRGESGEAERRFETALKTDPGYPAAHANLGQLLSKRGDLAGAVTHYRAALRSNPRSGITRYYLAGALGMLAVGPAANGPYAAMLRARQDYPSTPPSAPSPLSGEAALLEAVEQYKQAAQLSPGVAAPAAELAGALSLLGRHADAVTAYGEAARLAPEAGLLYEGLGAELEALGRPAEAAAAYRKALELQPSPSLEAARERAERAAGRR